jgi:hypothetical protein
LKRRDTPVDFMELNNRTCRQPSDIDGNPPSLVLGQLLCLQRFGVVVPREDVRECLPVGIADGVAARDLGRAKAAESDE